jgi:hypothetical protein
MGIEKKEDMYGQMRQIVRYRKWGGGKFKNKVVIEGYDGKRKQWERHKR